MAVCVGDDVMRLLREQASLYARLEHFALRQRRLVRDEDSGPLLSLLADRQRLSAELTQVARRLAPVRAEWPTYREGLSESQRAEAEGLLRDASTSLRRVIEGDEQDARLLAIRKQTVSQELRATHAVGGAISAYGAKATAAGSRRLDEST